MGLKTSKVNRFFSSPITPRPALGPPTFLLSGFQGSFPGLKQRTHMQLTAHLWYRGYKSEWRYTSTPPICLHGVDGDTFNLLTPSGSSHTTRFNIQKFYMALALR